MMEYWDLFIIGGNWALAIYFLLRALKHLDHIPYGDK